MITRQMGIYNHLTPKKAIKEMAKEGCPTCGRGHCYVAKVKVGVQFMNVGDYVVICNSCGQVVIHRITYHFDIHAFVRRNYCADDRIMAEEFCKKLKEFDIGYAKNELKRMAKEKVLIYAGQIGKRPSYRLNVEVKS